MSASHRRWLRITSGLRRNDAPIQSADGSAATERGAHRGQAMVEFALIATAFFMIVFGTIDFGRAIFVSVEMHNAVRDAGRYARVETSNGNARGGLGMIPDWVHYQYDYDTSGTGDTWGTDAAHARPAIGSATVTYSCGACQSGDQLTITATLPFKAFTQNLLKISPITLTASTTVTLE
jgi:Flp pilus assembly protein TadG